MHTLYMLERLCDYLATYEQKEVSMQRWVISLYWKICKPTELKCLFEKDFHVKLCRYVCSILKYVSSKPKSHGCGD